MRYKPSGDNEWNIKDGVFYMQRVNDKYLARFFFDADGVSHYKDDIEFTGETNVHTTGECLSGIVFKGHMVAPGCVLPELPAFDFVDNSEFDDDTSFTVSGYPAETLAEDL